MIGKLRRKFVIINMALIAVVLLILVSVIGGMLYRQEREQGEAAMRMALGRDYGTQPQRFKIGPEPPEGTRDNAPMLPVFSVTVDWEGNYTFHDTQMVDVAEETVLAAVEEAAALDKKNGYLPELNLRFMIEEKPHGTKYAFLDRSVEQADITRQILLLVLVYFGALAVFFPISVFLANWALRPVEKAWAQQQQFVADASHELKTPLTVILANLDILRGHGSETVASQEKWVDNTRAEATRMRKLVDGMLFLAKSDATEHTLQSTRLSLTDLVWRCCLLFEPVAYEQRLSIETDIAPDISITGDEALMNQLLAILLDNACKYAETDGVIAVSLQRQQDRAVISVQNTGDVIAPEAIPHLFERFYRADRARTRVEGGYGIGLSIAKQIVRQHNGKIKVSSDAKTGTTFSVSLPLDAETT